MLCSICSNKVNRRIQQDTAPTCSDRNCVARCHQACHGLSINQTCHAKNSGCHITWKCPQHCSGIAEIIIPPPPVFELSSRPSAVGKYCSVCKNPIRTRYADLAYHCANPPCDNACHLAATCNEFANPRRIARARNLSTRVWHCHIHSSSSASAHPPAQPGISPPRPTPPSLKSLLNQGQSQTHAKSSKEKCTKCSAALRSNTVPVRCSVCIKSFHQALDRKPRLAITNGNVKSAPTFSRIVHLNIQIITSLELLTHLLHNLCQLLREISWKFTSGTLMVFVQNS